MHERSWTLILAPALLVASTVSPSFAYTFCDASLYGTPSLSDCSKLLFGNGNPARGARGLESLDRHPHLFYTEDFDQRPVDATPAQWRNKARLPKTLSFDSCTIFLAIGFGANGDMFQYDTGIYPRIARQASGILSDCTHYDELEDIAATMQGGQGWTGDKGQILTLVYSNTSAFAEALAETGMNSFLPELKAISARNPSTTIPEPNPTCGTVTHCSKASDCKGAFGCMCIADQWHGDFVTSKCKWPYLGFRRGTLEIDSANATDSDPAFNNTLTDESRTNLACPCNCTYVSEACCNSTSGIVYEAPNLRLGSVQAPSANLTCNATTGDFQTSNVTLDVVLTPRGVVGERSEADALGSLTGFIGM